MAYVAITPSSPISCSENSFVVINPTSSNELDAHAKLQWIVGSGVSSRMTNDPSLFDTYRSTSSLVHIGDLYSLPILNIGDITFGDAAIHDVLHLPKFSTNLLSISKVASKGLGVYFDDEVIEVIDC